MQNSQHILRFVFCFFAAMMLLTLIVTNVGYYSQPLYGDSIGYLEYSTSYSLLSFEFWSAMRPAGYLLILKLFQNNVNGVITFQILYSFVAWTYLAYILFKNSSRNYLKIFSYLTFIFPCLYFIGNWNAAILTESITISTLVFIISFLLEYYFNKNSFFITLSLLFILFYSTLRDTNSYHILGFLLSYSALLYRHNKRLLIIAILSIMVGFIYSNLSANNAYGQPEGKRWYVPFLNIVGFEMLNNPQMLTFFTTQGMPISEDLTQKRGLWSKSLDVNGYSLYDDPSLNEFRRYVLTEGKSDYMKYLILNPSYTFGELLLNVDTVLDLNKKMSFYSKIGIDQRLYIRISPGTIILTLLLFICITIGLRTKRINYSYLYKPSIFSLSLVAPILGLAIISYHGDSMEQLRHCLMVPVSLSVSLYIYLFLLIETKSGQEVL